MTSLPVVALLIALYVALLFAMRFIALKLLRMRMGAVSTAMPADANLDSLAQVRPATELQFERVDTRPASAEAIEARHAAAVRARWLLRLACALDLVIALAYMFILDTMVTSRGLLGDSMLGYMVLTTLYLTILRYPVYRRQYFARRGWLRDHRGGPLWLLEWVTSPRWQPVLRLLLLASAVQAVLEVWPSSPGIALVLALPTLLLAAAMVWLGRHVQHDPGLSLLFLRVFGGGASAQLTFKGLLERWQHVGLYYTVIDPARLRQRAQVVGWFRLIGGINVIWLSALVGAAYPAVVALLVLEWWMVYAPIFKLSVASRDGLTRLRNEAVRKPRTSSLSFRCLELPCYENTWRFTVGVVAGHVQVILMDLRDYTRGRQGSEFEINFLLDSVPLSHVLFLVLPQEEQQAAVQQVMRDRWQSLAADSPNLALANPSAKLFAVGMAPVASDMQRMMDELIGMAIIPRPPGAVSHGDAPAR